MFPLKYKTQVTGDQKHQHGPHSNTGQIFKFLSAIPHTTPRYIIRHRPIFNTATRPSEL